MKSPEEDCLHRVMTPEEYEPVELEGEDFMSTNVLDEPTTKIKKPRKAKRIDSEGKPMRRLILVLSDSDYNRVTMAISVRFSPLFSKVYGGGKISMNGPQEETSARAIARICDDWLGNLEE